MRGSAFAFTTRLGVPKISELDRRGRAGLLAGGLDVAVAHLASGEPRIDLHPIDSLRAVGALLHDALARTVTSGFIASLRLSGVSLVKLKKLKRRTL